MSQPQQPKGDILIVDDQEANREVLSVMLAGYGYRVRTVPSGQRALGVVRESPPDLILLDILMPGMDGFEVCRQLKAHETTGKIPVIFVSALGAPQEKIKGFNVGGVDFVTRPFQVDEVVARVETHLALRAMQQRLEERNIRLRDALAEKDVLLKEIHHRVKNNLQIVSALLSFQAEAVGDERVQAAFEESHNRIQSMARVHEQLYRSADLGQIEMDIYVQGVTTDLREAFGAHDIIVHTHADGVLMAVDLAIPCGLIINELVSNAIKHAFTGRPDTGGERGRIRVSLRFLGNGAQYVLVVEDNGLGLPPGLDLENPQTLGLRLVKMLTRQLHGKLEVDNLAGEGASFRITFPPAKRNG